jgi:16S rRNA (guanine1207-N2)-methyltransferase
MLHFRGMNAVLDTLFLPLTQGLKAPENAVFLNAELHPAVGKGWVLHQHFKPYADALKAQGFICAAHIPDVKSSMIFILLPKNAAEADYLIVRALLMLQDGGTLVCVAANDAGGARLKKTLARFGLSCDELSKNKARVAIAIKKEINNEEFSSALISGAMQPVLHDAFMSQPGLFSWNRIDKGSKILAEHLPAQLKGRVADFGCGYGWLSQQVVDKCDELISIDADARAVEACKINVPKATCKWADLTREAENNLDWVIMNPPFHEGKSTDAAIGRAFIETATKSLKKGGQLWMVANAQLPYEVALKKNFSSFSKKYEGNGFKVINAVK